MGTALGTREHLDHVSLIRRLLTCWSFRSMHSQLSSVIVWVCRVIDSRLCVPELEKWTLRW